jgi:hypothetical protein
MNQYIRAIVLLPPEFEIIFLLSKEPNPSHYMQITEMLYDTIS